MPLMMRFKFAPAALAGVFAYGATSTIGSVSGNSISILGTSISAPLAFGLYVGASHFLAQNFGDYALPKLYSYLPFNVSPSNQVMLLTPAVVGGGGALLFSYAFPYEGQNWQTNAVLGAMSSAAGNTAAKALSLTF